MDPQTQHKYIKQIYQGTRDFMEEYNDSLKKSALDDLGESEVEKAKADAEKARAEAETLRKELEELKAKDGHTEEVKRSPGRPPKQAA